MRSFFQMALIAISVSQVEAIKLNSYTRLNEDTPIVYAQDDTPVVYA